MFTLSEDEVRARLDPARVVAAIEEAFRVRYPTVAIPPRTHLPMENGAFLIMACYDQAGQGLGMKLVTVHEKAVGATGRIQATYLLLDTQTGSPKATIAANWLTDLRTAATSAVATKFLAAEDVKTLGVFGTGRQAQAHLRILPLVRRFHRALVCGTDFNETRKLAACLSSETGLAVEAADARTCATEADVLCTCTNSQFPLFDGSLLRPGTHLNLVGAFRPQAREVDSMAVQRAKIVVDTYEGCLAEAGDLLIPMHEGALSRQHILADLHELCSGVQIRSGRDDITLFKSVGCALEDLVTAEMLVP